MTTSYIVNGTLIDGSGAKPTTLRWLRVRDGRVDAVETDPLAPLPEGADILFDARGLTVLPGLIDAHCHTTYGEAKSEEEQDLYTSVEYRTLRTAHNVKKILRAGFTSVSDPGTTCYAGVAVRDAITAGMCEGPRMVVAGQFLTSPTSLTDFYPSWIGVPGTSSGVLTNTVEEMLKTIRTQVKNGVDLIKICASGEGPILTPGGGSVPSFRKEELKIMVDEAHRLNKRVTAHARSGVAISDCIDAGVDWLMHGEYMSEEDVEKLADSGIPLCPSLTFVANIADFGHLAGVGERAIELMKRQLDRTVHILHYAHARGVPMISGTDSGFALTAYGEWHARELELLMKYAGLSAMEAVVSATSRAAMTVLPNDVGLLKPGRFADVLIVDGDPLEDIRVLQDRSRIRAVIKGGELVDLQVKEKPIDRFPFENVKMLSRNVLRWADAPRDSSMPQQLQPA